MASPEGGGEIPDKKLILPAAVAPKTPPRKTHRRNRSDPPSDSSQKKKRPGPLSSSSLATAGSSTATCLEDPTTPKGTRQLSPQMIPQDASAHRPPAYRRPIQHGYYGDPFPWTMGVRTNENKRYQDRAHVEGAKQRDEIAELESILAELDTAEYLANAGLGLRSRRGGNGGGAKRVQVMGAVAWKLREYNTALKNFADVADTLGEAREDEIKAYQEWIEHERPLVEAEARFIDCQMDLISLRKKREEGRTPMQGGSAQKDAATGESADSGNSGTPPPAAHDKSSDDSLPFPRTTKLCATVISIAISGALGAWTLLKKPDFQLPVVFTIGACGGALGVMWLCL